MDRLRWVSARRSDELVRLLVLREGFDDATARRFVDLAVDDLLESYRWQTDRLPPADAHRVADARRLLGFVHGNAIASAVGIPTPRAWQALRTLVPRLLRMAAEPVALGRTA